MPWASPRPCSKPGCDALVEAVTDDRCPLHKRDGWRHELTPAQRGYDWQWDLLRRRILERDNYICQHCKVRVATHVHHVKTKAQGGTDNPSNLLSLCARCHKEEHNKMQRA